MMRSSQRQDGFTIIEMIVVIITIAILAAITIVAFNGVQKRARDSMVQAELANAQKQIQLFRGTNANFPTAINACPNPTATSICYTPANGVTMNYYVDNTSSPAYYYINAKYGTSNFRLGSDDPTPVATSGTKVLFVSTPEQTGANEFLKFVDLAPTIDANGLISYTISFDIKSANTSTKNTATVYQQNGSGAKYTFSATVPVTTSYTHQVVTVTPTSWMATETQSWLAFYGTYSTGNILSVKNVVVEKTN
jgi:prepilin-type N-terminal cleavage/methylation domain-containing protein